MRELHACEPVVPHFSLLEVLLTGQPLLARRCGFAARLMKQLPIVKELLELFEITRIAAEKARETSELATAIAYKILKTYV